MRGNTIMQTAPLRLSSSEARSMPPFGTEEHDQHHVDTLDHIASKEKGEEKGEEKSGMMSQETELYAFLQSISEAKGPPQKEETQVENDHNAKTRETKNKNSEGEQTENDWIHSDQGSHEEMHKDYYSTRLALLSALKLPISVPFDWPPTKLWVQRCIRSVFVDRIVFEISQNIRGRPLPSFSAFVYGWTEAVNSGSTTDMRLQQRTALYSGLLQYVHADKLDQAHVKPFRAKPTSSLSPSPKALPRPDRDDHRKTAALVKSSNSPTSTTGSAFPKDSPTNEKVRGGSKRGEEHNTCSEIVLFYRFLVGEYTANTISFALSIIQHTIPSLPLPSADSKPVVFVYYTSLRQTVHERAMEHGMSSELRRHCLRVVDRMAEEATCPYSSMDDVQLDLFTVLLPICNHFNHHDMEVNTELKLTLRRRFVQKVAERNAAALQSLVDREKDWEVSAQTLPSVSATSDSPPSSPSSRRGSNDKNKLGRRRDVEQGEGDKPRTDHLQSIPEVVEMLSKRRQKYGSITFGANFSKAQELVASSEARARSGIYDVSIEDLSCVLSEFIPNLSPLLLSHTYEETLRHGCGLFTFDAFWSVASLVNLFPQCKSIQLHSVIPFQNRTDEKDLGYIIAREEAIRSNRVLDEISLLDSNCVAVSKLNLLYLEQSMHENLDQISHEAHEADDRILGSHGPSYLLHYWRQRAVEEATLTVALPRSIFSLSEVEQELHGSNVDSVKKNERLTRLIAVMSARSVAKRWRAIVARRKQKMLQLNIPHGFMKYFNTSVAMDKLLGDSHLSLSFLTTLISTLFWDATTHFTSMPSPACFSFCTFIYDWHVRTYGSHRLALVHLFEMFDAVDRYREESSRVRLFAKLIELPSATISREPATTTQKSLSSSMSLFTSPSSMQNHGSSDSRKESFVERGTQDMTVLMVLFVLCRMKTAGLHQPKAGGNVIESAVNRLSMRRPSTRLSITVGSISQASPPSSPSSSRRSHINLTRRKNSIFDIASPGPTESGGSPTSPTSPNRSNLTSSRRRSGDNKSSRRPSILSIDEDAGVCMSQGGGYFFRPTSMDVVDGLPKQWLVSKQDGWKAVKALFDAMGQEPSTEFAVAFDSVCTTKARQLSARRSSRRVSKRTSTRTSMTPQKMQIDVDAMLELLLPIWSTLARINQEKFTTEMEAYNLSMSTEPHYDELADLIFNMDPHFPESEIAPLFRLITQECQKRQGRTETDIVRTVLEEAGVLSLVRPLSEAIRSEFKLCDAPLNHDIHSLRTLQLIWSRHHSQFSRFAEKHVKSVSRKDMDRWDIQRNKVLTRVSPSASITDMSDPSEIIKSWEMFRELLLSTWKLAFAAGHPRM